MEWTILVWCACFVLASGIDQFVVIDAGTRVSTVALTSWDSQRVSVIHVCQTGTGISKFLDDHAGASDDLVKCIKSVAKHAAVLPDGLPVFLAATGDMRVQDEDKASQLYTSIEKDLRDAGFIPVKVGTLLESDELACAWLSANYRSINSRDKQATVGVLEMTEMRERSAFEVDSSGNPAVNLSAFDKHYIVNVFTSMCTGLKHSEYR